MGLATWYSPDSDYTGLPQNLQPMDRSLVPSGRGAPGVGIQTCCVIHGCLGHRLGSHVQRARSSGVWTGPQLRWHSNCLELLAVLLALSRLRGRLPYGQHSDLCVYQPAMHFTLLSYVATCPSPPPLESEASEVASYHPHPRSVQSDG